MLINGIDITSLNIKLYDRILTSNTVKAVNEWADGSLEPYYVRSQDTFKKMTLTFLVLEPDEQEAFLKMSQLTQMLKKATIKFDDLDFQFDVVFNGTNKPSRLKNGNFLITYDLASGYARSLDREVYTTDIGATSTFRLNVVYYQNGNIFAGQDTVLIRSVSFSEQETPTLSSIGIDVDKFKDEHYKSGVASNLGLMELTYDNLQSLGVLIINYEPIQYSVEVRYIIDSGSGYQQSLQDNEQALQKKYNELMEPIQKKVLDAINAVGQAGGYVYIMQTGSALYISSTLSEDVTAKVKAKLGLK